MDCRDAQFYLRLRRHTADELGAEVVAELDRHVSGCSSCAAQSRSAARFDRALAAVMCDVPIPAGLRDRLVVHLSAQRGAVLRRKAYRYVGVAAALFLTMGITYGMFWKARPQADTTALVHSLDRRVDGELAEVDVRDWLVAQKLPPQLPEPFDYRCYLMHGTEPVQGRDVPVVVFRDPLSSEMAKVYIFREGLFDLQMMAHAQASHWQARVYTHEVRGVVYVITFTGPTLDPFLRTGLKG